MQCMLLPNSTFCFLAYVMVYKWILKRYLFVCLVLVAFVQHDISWFKIFQQLYTYSWWMSQLLSDIYIYIGRCSYESYSHSTMRVRVGALTSISKAYSLNVRALAPYSHSTVRVTLTRASPIYILWFLDGNKFTSSVRKGKKGT